MKVSLDDKHKSERESKSIQVLDRLRDIDLADAAEVTEDKNVSAKTWVDNKRFIFAAGMLILTNVRS